MAKKRIGLALRLEATETARTGILPMDVVLAAERVLGDEPRDVSAERCGSDIESRVPPGGRLRFIEVKGRHKDGKTITVTKNESLTALNKPEDFMLAIVLVNGDAVNEPQYVRRPFQKEPDFGVTSVNYDMGELLARARDPQVTQGAGSRRVGARPKGTRLESTLYNVLTRLLGPPGERGYGLVLSGTRTWRTL